MVDERQTVRQVLDSLLDKSHCGYSLDWSLVEIITELQMGKSQWTDPCLVLIVTCSDQEQPINSHENGPTMRFLFFLVPQ